MNLSTIRLWREELTTENLLYGLIMINGFWDCETSAGNEPKLVSWRTTHSFSKLLKESWTTSSGLIALWIKILLNSWRKMSCQLYFLRHSANDLKSYIWAKYMTDFEVQNAYLIRGRCPLRLQTIDAYLLPYPLPLSCAPFV